jgi:hypothetical protein
MERRDVGSRAHRLSYEQRPSEGHLLPEGVTESGAAIIVFRVEGEPVIPDNVKWPGK